MEKTKNKVSVNAVVKAPLDSFESRLSDFNKKAGFHPGNRFKNSGSAYAPCINPYNVKMITEVVIEENKNPLWHLMFEDVIEKAEIAIKEDRLMTEGEAFAIQNYATDNNIRFSCMDEYIKSCGENLDISPEVIKRVLAYAPKEYHTQLLINVPWDTEIKVKKETRSILAYALQKSSTNLILKKFEEIPREKVKEIIESEKAFQKEMALGAPIIM